MKLDYMQFLELEIFTRFGAKLDKNMQNKIHRGRLLREIFKQDRLSPMPIEFQLAWLIAYNEHLLDNYQPEEISTLLKKIAQSVLDSKLTLSSPRNEWIALCQKLLI